MMDKYVKQNMYYKTTEHYFRRLENVRNVQPVLVLIGSQMFKTSFWSYHI